MNNNIFNFHNDIVISNGILSYFNKELNEKNKKNWYILGKFGTKKVVIDYIFLVFLKNCDVRWYDFDEFNCECPFEYGYTFVLTKPLKMSSDEFFETLNSLLSQLQYSDFGYEGITSKDYAIYISDPFMRYIETFIKKLR